MSNKSEYYSIWEAVHKSVWNNNNFSNEKAYVTCLLSELAYKYIPKYEIDKIKRVKIVPCFEYQNIISSGESINFNKLLLALDFRDYFIIEENKMIIIGIKLKNILFISVRGTHQLYDWFVNINIRKMKMTFFDDENKYHSGFLNEVLKVYNALFLKIEEFSVESTKVIFTGHSLGGALSSILYSLSSCLKRETQCFTFGMPRYGDKITISSHCPHHILNEFDIVPSLPPKIFGYCNSLSEYLLNNESITPIHIRDKKNLIEWVKRIRQVGKEHSIEQYKLRLINLL
ncbi:lipase family protein [Rossellomorea aquimaris]|uniref:Lipase (Class 3) n=1 Tax=Rossellomorea aquimaris TaxID=189382 RepID=A0A366ESP0_9BACI|nr:lipase family protein [Rossellomorea aquimaris]RBP04495.1 lipase (class 3) [Rossellomorea aquimaris]